MATVKSITTHGLLPGLHAVNDEQMDTAVREQAEALEAILTTHAEQARTVQTDPGLTPFGKQQRLEALKRSTLAAIDATAGKRFGEYDRERIREQAGRLQKTIELRFTCIPTPDGMALTQRVPKEERERAELRKRELRDRLLAVTDLQRFEIAQQAAIRNDLELLSAIREAPAAFPILSEEQWAAVDEKHVTVHHAAEARRLNDLDALAGTFQFNLNGARKAVGGEPTRAVVSDPKVQAELDAMEQEAARESASA